MTHAMNAPLQNHRDTTMSTDRSSFLTFAFAVFLMLALAPTGEALAQPVPVTDIENAAGDSVLTVFEDGGFAAYGEGPSGFINPGPGEIPAEGGGVRMMWYPAKAAFRVGDVGSNQWDDANIGLRSVAFGSSPEASGRSSTAMGSSTEAIGNTSTAMGSSTIASGTEATAMGGGTEASGVASTAMGEGSEASGDQSTAMGNGTTASGDQSTAMGDNATASGGESTAMGFNTEASGDFSTAMGNSTTAATANSLSIGNDNTANQTADNTAFVVGNGGNPDALVLDFDGNMTLAGGLTETSDRRLKEQIQPLGSGVLSALGEIKPVHFQFKDNRTHPSGTQIGLIAQEVQAQFPALVSEGASGHLSVSYSKFTAVLLKGLQEQQAQIQKQQKQIERLRDHNTQIAALQAEVDALKEERSQTAGWGPAAGGLLGLLLLGGCIVAVRRWGTPHAASLWVLTGVGALLLGTAPAAAQTVTIQNGATVSVQNGSVFDLGANTALVEEESSGARVTGGTGVVTATRTLNTPSSVDVAGLGAVITASQNLGPTTVVRGHAVQTDNNNESIARYYDIQPSQNNSGLDATLTFNYRDAELNGLAGSTLTLFRSDDGGSSYGTAGHDSRDATANTVTLSGIGSFSRWTLGSTDSPLPVELTAFDARADGETVQLAWKTASETNNAGFDVQRKRSSDDGWTQVGFVEGHGTTSEAQTYSFDDAGVPFEADSLRYRLKQVDLDGAFEYSEAVEVAIATPGELTLHGNYPNPFANQTTIRYEVPQTSEARIAVYNVIGQQVTTLVSGKQAAGRHQVRLDASRLSSGVYFVRLTHDGTTRTQKITIVR
jgi:hypothetical protein